MNRQQVLDDAGRAVSVDRNGTYGEPEDNLGRIAALWSVLFEREITPRQVAWAMVLLKVAREVHAPNDDNPIDVAGYAAIAGEVSAVPHRTASGFDEWLASTRMQLVRDMRDVHPWSD